MTDELPEIGIRLGESDGFRRSQVIAMSDLAAQLHGEAAVLRARVAVLEAEIAQLKTEAPK